MFVEAPFIVTKIDEVEQLVFGYANVSVSKRGDVLEDLQHDIIPPKELERAAYQFVLKYRGSDEMHKGPVIGHLVESMVFTPEKLVKFATDPTTGMVDTEGLAVLQKLFPARWWIGVHVPDRAVFAKVQSGEYKMFSIAGEAEKEAA